MSDTATDRHIACISTFFGNGEWTVAVPGMTLWRNHDGARPRDMSWGFVNEGKTLADHVHHGDTVVLYVEGDAVIKRARAVAVAPAKPAIDLTFHQLRLANLRRLPLYKNKRGEPAHSQPDGSDWSEADWMVAVVGEVGEACNRMKKLRRGDHGPIGCPEYVAEIQELAHEMADYVTYTDILALQFGIDLGTTVREKFNVVSERVGCTVFL